MKIRSTSGLNQVLEKGFRGGRRSGWEGSETDVLVGTSWKNRRVPPRGLCKRLQCIHLLGDGGLRMFHGLALQRLNTGLQMSDVSLASLLPNGGSLSTLGASGLIKA